MVLEGVCERGHEFWSEWEAGPLTPFCGQCGAATLEGCPSCKRELTVLGGGYAQFARIAPFCQYCGAAYPWVGRKERIYELENRLAGQDLDPATALELRELLQVLADDELTDKERKQKWARLKRLAPGLWEQAQPLIETVVSATIKSQL